MLLLWIIVRCSQCNSRLLEYHHHHILWHKWESLLQRDTYWMSTVIAVLRVISKDVSRPEQYDHGIWPWSFILKISIMFFFHWDFEVVRLNSRASVFQVFLFVCFSPSASVSLTIHLAPISPCHDFQLQLASFLFLRRDSKPMESNFPLSLGKLWIRPFVVSPSKGWTAVAVWLVTDDSLLWLMKQDNKLLSFAGEKWSSGLPQFGTINLLFYLCLFGNVTWDPVLLFMYGEKTKGKKKNKQRIIY